MVTFTSKELSKLRVSSAEALVAVLHQMYPGIDLIDLGVSDFGFFIDVEWREPITKEVFPLILERVEKLPIDELEMVPASAYGLLKSRGMYSRAKKARKSPYQFLSIFKMGEYVDWPGLSFSSEIGAISLHEVEVRGKICRINGTAYPNKQILKTAQKELAKRWSLSWETLCLDYFYLEEGKVWWEPKGERLKQNIYQWWSKRHPKPIATPLEDKYEAHRKYFDKSGFSIVSEWGEGDVTHFFSKAQKDIISSLQLIQEIITIFEITCHVVCTGSRLRPLLNEVGMKAENGQGAIDRLDVYYVDVFGRESQGPFLEWQDDVVMVSCFGSVLELIKNLLEGTIPSWLDNAG